MIQTLSKRADGDHRTVRIVIWVLFALVVVAYVWAIYSLIGAYLAPSDERTYGARLKRTMLFRK